MAQHRDQDSTGLFGMIFVDPAHRKSKGSQKVVAILLGSRNTETSLA
jgi:hypothetical protein